MNRPNQNLQNANRNAAQNPPSGNQSPKNKEKEDWRRFRMLYSFFILLVILYAKRPNVPDDTQSTLLQLLTLSFTEKEYMNQLNNAMEIIFPKITGASNANKAIIQVRENKDANFQARIMNAMKVMFNVKGFMDIYKKMYEADARIQNNKDFFMTFQSLVNLGQSTYDPDAEKILRFLMEPNGGALPAPAPAPTPVPSIANNGSVNGSINAKSLLSTASAAITNIAGKVSASIQRPSDKLSPEKVKKLTPFREMLQKVSADFIAKSIYRGLPTSVNLQPSAPAPVPNATPVPAPNAATPLPPATPVSNATSPLPPAAPVPNASAPLPPAAPVSNASAPLPPAAPVKGGGKVKLNRSNPNSTLLARQSRAQSSRESTTRLAPFQGAASSRKSSKSFSRVSLRKLWEMS